jgi:hypothetical protein
MSASNFSLDSVTKAVNNLAGDYQNAVTGLMNAANSSTGLDISNGTVKTVEVQTSQALLELYTAGVKSVADHLKALARKIS